MADGDVLALNAAALRGWLQQSGIRLTGNLEVARVGLGQSNLTYALSDDSGVLAIARRPPLGHLLASAHDVGREYRILTALADTSVAVPGVIGLCEDKVVSDAPVLVVEFVEGAVVDSLAQAESLAPEARYRIGTDLGRLLADIHAVDLDRTGLTTLASHAPYAPRQLKRWSRQWHDSKTRELPTLDKLTQWLQVHLPEPGPTTLVHGDLHIRNVIVDPVSGEVRAALDWELSTLGDPLADLGTTLAYWPEPDDPALGLFAASALPGFASREDIIAAYQESSGRDAGIVRYWQVLGMWKIAIIAEGVRRRAIDEPSNAAEGGPPPASLIEKLIEHAWHFAGQAAIRR